VSASERGFGMVLAGCPGQCRGVILAGIGLLLGNDRLLTFPSIRGCTAVKVFRRTR